MKVALALAVGVLSARPARADQCEWLDDASIARRAARELASHPDLVELCEPCGDEAPSAPRRAGKVEVRAVDGHSELAIDGETVDLAYVYVRTSDRQYRNLAMLAGCATTGVSTSLHVDRESPTSVLIRAESAPHAAPSDPALAPPAATPTIVIVEPPGDTHWFAFVTLAAALGALAAWRVARRRLRHVPRAVTLEFRD